MSITDDIAEFALADCQAASALSMMRLSIFDWAACGIAGCHEPASKIVRDMVLHEGGADEAILFGGGKAPARAAALVNGVTSHALDFDDTHFSHIGHPSVAVVSAALAVAQAVEAKGDDFLQGTLAGAEASIRIGSWLGREHYQAGFHQTGTAGCFGAAIASVRLLGCNHAEMAQAIGLASTRAAGLKSQFGTMGKPYNAGTAAAMGVEVALLAKAGFLANADGLDADQGFGPTHGGIADTSAFDSMGTDWLFEQVSHKFHACCHGTHAMIEALQKIESDPAQIRKIEVRTNPRWLKVCNQLEPSTGLEAKFSYRFIAALVLHGYETARLDTFSNPLTQDKSLTDTRDKVTVVADDTISEAGASVKLTGPSGTVESSADISTSMGLDERRAKLTAKAEALIGDRVELLEAAVLYGETPDLDRLGQLLGQGE